MSPREIVAKAWAITVKEGSIRKWGFMSAFVETLLNAKLFIFQAWLIYSYFWLQDPIGFFTIEKVLFQNLPNWLAVIIYVTFIILLIIEWLFPHMAKGAIIGLAAKSYKKEEVKGGFVLGLYNFWPIFAIHELLFLSGLTTVITLSSLSLRYGAEAGILGVGIIMSIWTLANVLEFFWIFSEEAVVIRKTGIRGAISKSFKLVISHIGHIVFLCLLLFFIFLRIIANLLMIILIPAIVMGVGVSLAFIMPKIVGYSVAVLLGIIIIFLASYFFAYLEVFRQTVWTITYIELSKLKELDVIEEDADVTK